MKIIRFVDEQGKVVRGTTWDGETASVVEGDGRSGFEDTGRRVKVGRVLPVVVPSRRHLHRT